jgi:hypothetical protein
MDMDVSAATWLKTRSTGVDVCQPPTGFVSVAQCTGYVLFNWRGARKTIWKPLTCWRPKIGHISSRVFLRTRIYLAEYKYRLFHLKFLFKQIIFTITVSYTSIIPENCIGKQHAV